MLGRIKRTSRLDVGLALSCAGAAFLLWALVAGVCRAIMCEVIRSTALLSASRHVIWPEFTEAVKVFFVDTGFVIDVVGLAWMLLSLALVFVASRQRISISWAWLSALTQILVAAMGCVLVGWLASRSLEVYAVTQKKTVLETLSQISLPVVIAIAVLIWVVFVIWMLVDRARLNRRGPTLTDGLRTNR